MYEVGACALNVKKPRLGELNANTSSLLMNSLIWHHHPYYVVLE